MPTGRHNLIQYGSYYFTTDGLSTGTPCKTETSGLKAIKRGLIGQTILALDGTAWQQSQSIKGLTFTFTVFRVLGSVLTQIYDMERAAILAGSSLTLNITGGGYGDFYLTCKPALSQTADGNDEFYLEKLYDVPFTVIIQSQSFSLTGSPGSIVFTGAAATLTQG